MHVPSVENDNAIIEQGKDLSIHLKAEDDQGHSLIFEITKQPSHGAFALDPSTGHLQYHSNPTYIGTDLISYIAICENSNESNQANIFIDVRKLNSPKTIELSIELPVNPDVDDILEAIVDFQLQLSELVNGEEAPKDSGV